jgi:iron(II)-dependent oxidoreductase
VRHPTFPNDVTRGELRRWYREGRARSKLIFSIPKDAAYYTQPIPLRNPIVFYEGHIPAFAVNTLIKLALQRDGIDADFEVLFARGIDPDSPDAARPPTDVWPPRDDVLAYGARADAMIEEALCNGPIDDGREPQRRNGEAALAILEHEPMHQETLLYMFHEMPYELKNVRAPLGAPRNSAGDPSPSQPALRSDSDEGRLRMTGGTVRVPAGVATLGSDDPFAWDNEYPSHRIEVGAFDIDRTNVTNGQYLEFINATGAEPSHFWLRRDGAWYWRGMFEAYPLPIDTPVYATHDEATAYARWRGRRLPTEAEYHRAAFGTPSGEERRFPWGDEPPDHTRGNFGFAHWDPLPVGSYPAGASAWGVHDLVGNGWEWTSTPFDGFPGFQPMASYPVYSNEFFDGKHYVLKGGSPATAPELIRRSFRNWFRHNYPYVYAKFRCIGV